MRLINVLAIILVIFIGIVLLYNNSQSTPQTARPQPTDFSSEGHYFIESCSYELRNSDRDFVLCCFEVNTDRVYLCNEKTAFAPGEHFSLFLDINRVNKYYEAYHLCEVLGPFEKTDPTPRFKSHPGVRGIYEGNEIACYTETFYQKDHHTVEETGFAPSEKGRFFVADIYLLPEGNYVTIEDFVSRIPEGKKVFSFEGEVV